MTVSAIDVVGWIGAALLLVAYVLVSLGRLDGRGAKFQYLNLVGGAGLATNSAASHAFPSAALNVIWMAIGVVALVRGARRKTQRRGRA